MAAKLARFPCVGLGSGWVDGQLVEGLIEISEDPAVLEDGKWWAVIGTYEGQWRFARFRERRPAPLPPVLQWSGVSGWQSSLSESEFCERVEVLRERIAAGEIYQTNLCRILSAPTSNDSLLGLAHKVQSGNPAPFFAWFELPDLSLVCASPERYLERRGERLLSSPIKGTAPTPEEMLEKDRAENVMIVDLVRHDLGQIAVAGSVTTPRLLAMENHPGLVHLVSDIECELRPDTSWAEIFAATFPAGSITGAPKVTAMKAIAELEPTPRGPYCGAIGWVEGKSARLAVGIRTFYLKDGILHFGTGAGITWASEPRAEWKETELKASRLIGLAQ